MSEGLLILYVLGAWLVIFTAAALYLRWRRGAPSARDRALEELSARYARGDISRQQYDRERRRLDSSEPPTSS